MKLTIDNVRLSVYHKIVSIENLPLVKASRHLKDYLTLTTQVMIHDSSRRLPFTLLMFFRPDAFDNQLILKTLKDILDGRVCQIPVYDFKTNSRMEDEFVTIYPADVVLFEGILVFYLPEIRDFFHMKLFVDTDADTRLSRRGMYPVLLCINSVKHHILVSAVLRDIRERGRDLEQVLTQYTILVKPAFEEFCLPVSLETMLWFCETFSGLCRALICNSVY